MRIFISWSGPLSQRIGEILHKYLPLMIKDFKTFLSKHIESGSRWNLELLKELSESSFGILCLTSQNLNSSWLLYEAGALTKHVEGRACGLLIGALRAVDISGPLSQFQHRSFSKDDFCSLLMDINSKLDEPLEAKNLDLILQQWWNDIERDYKEALDNFPDESKRPLREEREILEEILSRVRVIEKGQLTSRTLREYHLKLTGNNSDIKNFLMDLRNIDFGGYPTVFQQYSENHAAVNIRSEGSLDLNKIKELARNKVKLELIEI